MKQLLLLLVLLSIGLNRATAQEQVVLDSLQSELKNAETDTGKVKVLLAISSQYIKYNYVQAAEYARLANDLAVKSKSDKFIARSYHSLAGVFFGMSDYKNASTNYFKALKFYENQKDTLGTLYMNINLGAVNDRLQEFEKALSYYLKAQDMITNMNTRQQKIIALLPTLYNNIANIYQTKKDEQAALQYYMKALALAEESKNKSLQGIALNNLGKLYLNELKQYDKAFEYLNRGLAIRKEVGDKAEISKSYNLLANYYLYQKDYDNARASVNMAIQLAEEIGSLELQKFSYSSLSEIEDALGHYQESLKAYKTFKSLSDSIQNQLAGSEITRLQLQYDFEKANQEREQEKRETRFQYTIIIIVLSTGLVLAVLIAMVVRARARQTELKRKNLAQDMEIKNKELTTNVMYLIRKNELINDVAERLLKVQHTVLPENQKVIHEIIFDLQKEADSDIWKEFELRFNQVHSDFYNKLRSLYPGLSPADEKLCAFLRLNMSSKEIAAITQQSVKSVEVARARLRKKLSLTNTNSNLVTYLSGL